jgi:hypothetical protein
MRERRAGPTTGLGRPAATSEAHGPCLVEDGAGQTEPGLPVAAGQPMREHDVEFGLPHEQRVQPQFAHVTGGQLVVEGDGVVEVRHGPRPVTERLSGSVQPVGRPDLLEQPAFRPRVLVDAPHRVLDGLDPDVTVGLHLDAEPEAGVHVGE